MCRAWPANAPWSAVGVALGSPRRPSLGRSGRPVLRRCPSPRLPLSERSAGARLPYLEGPRLSTAVQRRRGCMRGCCRPSCVHGIANGIHPGKYMLLSLEHDVLHQGGRMAGVARACMCVRHQMSIRAEGQGQSCWSPERKPHGPSGGVQRACPSSHGRCGHLERVEARSAARRCHAR